MKLIDDNNNKLMIGDDGIYLKLAKDPKVRQILSFRHGRIIKFVRKSNVFTPKNGTAMVGFNYYSLKLIKERMNRINIIYIKISNKYKKVSIDELLKNGKFLHFLKSGFEKQIFYNVEDMIDV
ncbi:MAG: hypothetical protein H8E98_01995 [Bacteroidetes bacterium]|nr:hypothetical protein [Bacteroidota bacterium]